jgi:hypothetical protein
MSKYTFVFEYKEGEHPGIDANATLFGGKIDSVSFHDVIEEADELRQRIEELEYQAEQMINLLSGFISYADCSNGIAGYHLNGNLLSWDEVDEVEQASELLAEIEGNDNE